MEIDYNHIHYSHLQRFKSKHPKIYLSLSRAIGTTSSSSSLLTRHAANSGQRRRTYLELVLVREHLAHHQEMERHASASPMARHATCSDTAVRESGVYEG